MRFQTSVCALAVFVGSQFAAAQPAPQRPAPTAPSRPAPQAKAPMGKAPMAKPPVAADPATVRDIEATFGFFPQFLRAVPATLLPAAWASLKNFQMSTNTQLDNKTKELIGLAVAAQIPCDYCVVFHTEVARANGASEEEIREAIGMAAVTREMSTMINGGQVDKAAFKRDLDRIMQRSRQQAKR